MTGSASVGEDLELVFSVLLRSRRILQKLLSEHVETKPQAPG